MTLIPIKDEDKLCFVACSDDKKKQGLCSCENRFNNWQFRQTDVVRQSEQLVCQESELDCPYDFTSRCTLGRCNCKPKAN